MGDIKSPLDHWKARGLDFSAILTLRVTPSAVERHCLTLESRKAPPPLDDDLIFKLQPALTAKKQMTLTISVRNLYRSVGTKLSHEIARRFGPKGLPQDTIVFNAVGTDGQSFGAFATPGLKIRLKGEANDYFAKGLSGAHLSIQPQEGDTTIAEDNIIVGNVALYDATTGEVYVRGCAEERFCVRNSGAKAVVEGVGDHGCEYMTGCLVVVLGATGRNFAAGMSGGIAYVLDSRGDFKRHDYNREMVHLEAVKTADDIYRLHDMITKHHAVTKSRLADRILNAWPDFLPRFIKVIPVEYQRVLAKMKREKAAAN